MIQPFVSGTAYRQVMESTQPNMYTFEFIDVSLLSLGAVLKLVEHYATQFGANAEWKTQLPFLRLLGDMGGLPRAISYLLEECFGKNFSQGRVFFQTISSKSFFPIFMRIADSVTNEYGIEGFVLKNKPAALQVLYHAIRNTRVTRDEVLGNVAIEQMEQDGQVFLQRVGTAYYFSMPFLFLFAYDQYLRIFPSELAEVAFNHDNTVKWKDWESLFHVFMNNLMIYEKDKTELTLGNFYFKADGQDYTKNLPVELGPLEVAPVVHPFPSKTQPVVLRDSKRMIDCTKYFVNTIFISGQQNNGGDFTLEQAKNEHKKAQETAKREGLSDSVTVIFTTQLFPKDKIQFIPKDILIIHQCNFKDYYGPFAVRAAFSITKCLNRNFDIQHLQVLVGEETAKAIESKQRRFAI
jgi:hypothetical protein